MAEETPRILIVDDDVDFASLLSDVFAQASYEVEMTGDPTKVEDLVKASEFSLVVTDLRMPGIDGFQLARKVKALKPDLPIIMVSGFLDSKDRERMEAEGIVGLYEKPLSVFSLLKNAAKLIAENKGKSRNQKGDGSDSKAGSESNDLGFPFSALPCKSTASHTFAESIFRLRNRRPNLCIITPPGIPARAIAENFCSWIDEEKTAGLILDPSDCTEERLRQITADAKTKGQENLVLCVPEVDRLDPAHQKSLAKGSRKGAFRDQWDGHIRIVFMIGTDVESLYQKGILGDELYLSMGGSEIHCPPLRECPEDIKHIARSLEGEGGVPLVWDDEAIQSLIEMEWPGNHAELRKTLLRIQQSYTGQAITQNDVSEALRDEDSQSAVKSTTHQKSLYETLEDCRYSYLHALADLVGQDSETVAQIAATPKELTEEVLNS